MNKVLVEASLDLATLEANQQITRIRSRISDENLNHRIEAENRYKIDRNFSAVCFIDFKNEEQSILKIFKQKVTIKTLYNN